MNTFQHHRWLLVWGLFLIALVAGPTIARAQEEQDAEPGENLPEPQQAALTAKQFNAWLDQTVFGLNQTAASSRARLTGRLELKLEHLNRTCGITEAQAKKLRLAGHGDIKRAFDRVNDNKRDFARIRDNQAEAAKLKSELEELGGAWGRALFEHGSIFAKTLEKTLSSEQVAKYTFASCQAKLFRHQAMVEQTVQVLDMAVGFKDRQRQRFTKLLLEKTRPAKSSRGFSFELRSVALQAARLPEATMKPMFDESQWRTLRAFFKELNDNLGGEVEGVVLDVEITECAPSAAGGPVARPGTTAELKDQ
jgi:hypothetical protein